MTQRLESPDGNLAIILSLSGPRDWYSVEFGGATVIADGTFGMHFPPGISSCHCSAQADIDESYDMLHGKQRKISPLYKSWICCNIEDDAVRGAMEFALSNHTIAFRFHQRLEPQYLETTIIRDPITFPIVKSADDYQLAQPYDRLKSQYQTFYQPREDRRLQPIGSALSTERSPDGFGLPALFRTDINDELVWLLLKEAGFYGQAPAMHIDLISELGSVSIAVPADENGNGSFGRGASLIFDIEHGQTWSSLWRIITIGSTPDVIVTDTSVTDLSLPSMISDTTWIQPGSTSWSWYAVPENPTNFTATKEYIDLAADQGWTYSLLDATWDQMVDEHGRKVDLEEINAYAKTKNVRLWVWMNTAGPNNVAYDVTPRDLLFDPEIRRQTMSWLSKLDIAGIKVDGIESEKAGMMRYLLDILADAAEFHLMIVFHNCPVPHGWERTWPNLLASEGLVTSEYYTNSEIAYAPQMPENNVNEAFVRLPIGTADYAPGTFSQDHYPFDAPITTYAHEIAMHIIADSGLRCFPEDPVFYRDELNQSITSFLTDIPFVWDSVRFMDGAPGKFFIVAKMAGDAVYVAGINGETLEIAADNSSRSAVGSARLLTVDLSSIHAKMTPDFIVSDVYASRLPKIGGKIFNGSHISLIMQPFGGFVVLLKVQHPTMLGWVDEQVSSISWMRMLLLFLFMASFFVIFMRWHKSRSQPVQRSIPP